MPLLNTNSGTDPGSIDQGPKNVEYFQDEKKLHANWNNELP